MTEEGERHIACVCDKGTHKPCMHDALSRHTAFVCVSVCVCDMPKHSPPVCVCAQMARPRVWAVMC